MKHMEILRGLTADATDQEDRVITTSNYKQQETARKKKRDCNHDKNRNTTRNKRK